MRRLPCPQDDHHDDVDEHRNEENDQNGAVQMNAGERDRAEENRDSLPLQSRQYASSTQMPLRVI